MRPKATKDEREVIHTVLQQLDTQGRLTPDEIIKEASNPGSPLHGEFTWDVDQAARKLWLAEARTLIASFRVSVIVNRKEYRVQEFVESPVKREDSQGYTSILKLKNSKSAAREFITRELGIASSYVAKTKEYAVIFGLQDRVDEIVEELETLKSDTSAANATA